MFRGVKLFKCDNCKKVTIALELELGSTALSQPIKCPKCGSWHTSPFISSKSLYKKFWKQYDK